MTSTIASWAAPSAHVTMSVRPLATTSFGRRCPSRRMAPAARAAATATERGDGSAGIGARYRAPAVDGGVVGPRAPECAPGPPETGSRGACLQTQRLWWGDEDSRGQVGELAGQRDERGNRGRRVAHPPDEVEVVD